MKRRRRAIITGATSFLGAETARAFLRAGYEIIAPVRPDSERRAFLPVHPHLRVIDMDMSEPEQLLKVMSEGALDAEIPSAGVTNRSEAAERGLSGAELCVHFAWAGVGVRGRMDPEIQAENVENTLRLIRTVRRLGCRRFLFAGSQAEYGMTLERVQAEGTIWKMSEETPCRPVSEYGKAKLRVLRQGGALAAETGMEYIHMRIFSVYGPEDHETSLVSACVRAALEGKRAELGPCAQLWNFLHVKDCAAAVLALAGAEEAAGVYNIGSLDTRPLKEFVREIFDIASESGYDGAGFSLNERSAGPEGTPYLAPDTEKLRRTAGWSGKISFAEGIRSMLRKELSQN